MEVKIYQFTTEALETVNYVFKSWDHAKDNFNLNDYERVYTMEMGDVSWCTNWEILDDIFFFFNKQIPEDFGGHSLSVSDVVSLDGQFYYCDRYGWSRITND